MIQVLLLDTETTGISNQDQVIEFAYLELPELAICKQVTPIYANEFPSSHKRYKPSVPIQQRALEVHGIREEDLQNCPPSSTLSLPKHTYMLGHNVSFDHRMLGCPTTKLICTMKLAQKLYKKLPPGKEHSSMHPAGEYVTNYKLPTLISELIMGGDQIAGEAHSALSDCYLTLILLDQILQRFPRILTWEELYLLQNNTTAAKREPKKIEVMPFGKHKGELFVDIPADYLKWLLKQELTEPLRKAVKEWV